MEIWILLAVWLVIERVITTVQIYFMRRDVNKIKASMHPPAIGAPPPPSVCMACNRVITSYPHYCERK